MSSERKILLTVFAVAALVILAIWLWPRLEAELGPELVAAWVAIEVDGAEMARSGRFVVDEGTPFTLHAVLEARRRDGSPLYYTRARRLELHGQEIEPGQLRRWDRALRARVLWFTIEGETPYLPLDAERGLEALRFQPLFRPEWPTEWSARGDVSSRYDEHLDRLPAHRRRAFGTQRYQARIEIESAAGPTAMPTMISSWGPEEVVSRVDEFPTLSVRLPGILGPASRAFGLTQVAVPDEAGDELLREIAEWARKDLLFTRATVLRQTLEVVGTSLEDLDWRIVTMGEPRWDREIFPGDLLRVGAQVAIAFRGREPGAPLALGDLLIELERGAKVTTIGEVFGERRRLDHARLGGTS